MNDINDPSGPVGTAMQEFGIASGNLLIAWLKTLPAEHFLAIDALIGKGAQIGIRFLAATPTKRPVLVVLLADPAGDYHVVAETMFERDTLQ